MKKTSTRLLITFVLILVFASILAVATFAAIPGTGYCVNMENKQTNIKWTMEENGVLTFEIAPAATDKVQTTALYGMDPMTGTKNSWAKCLPTFGEAVKIVIGDGITEIEGFSAMEKLNQVEIPTSLVRLGYSAFQCSRVIKSIYIRGTEPVDGLYDFSNITSFGQYACDSAEALSKVKLNPNYEGVLEFEQFKNTALTQVEIPAGVTVIKDNAFMKTKKLTIMTFLGMETTFESSNVLKDNKTFPAIKAKAGSKMAEFAKANGFTFIDLDTGEKTVGTKPTTGAPTDGEQGGNQSENQVGPQGGTTTPPTSEITEFDPEGATIWGHSSGEYNGSPIIDTYWAYYQETKTLEFVSATTKYNETGTIKNVDAEYTNWEEYKDEIEHVIVGDNIVKVSGNAFKGYPALIDVRLGSHVSQIDGGAFTGCSSLTTVWWNGTERVEGRVDLRSVTKFNTILGGTSVREVFLPKNVKEISYDMPSSIITIWVYEITPELIAFGEKNLFNIGNVNNPNEFYENWIYVDLTLPSCGGRCRFGFDEATGTLTVYGAGNIDDIVNYYGGGSKKQPWFSIRQNVKHIVISEKITTIGKYAFCEFTNLETVQLPAGDIKILNAAFEKCHNLKSVYIAGTEPIEGTADLRNVHELNSWTFAYDWLIANIIVSPQVEKIGTSVFEENISINLAGVYGTPGSYAEQYAADNGKAFYDIASNIPQPITCTPPETTVADTETEAPKTTKAPETTVTPETTVVPETTVTPETMPIFVDADEDSESSVSVLPIIAVIVVVVVAAVIVVIVVISKKKKAA